MITYKEGNLLDSTCKVICHQTNCKGAMGKGIAKQIREIFPGAYTSLRLRFEEGLAQLGEIDFRPCFDQRIVNDRYIVNMYAQDNYYLNGQGTVFTDYSAFRKCCKRLKLELKELYANQTNIIKIGFPDHIGCGLAGGDWNIVKQIIEEEFAGESWNVEIWRLAI